MEYQDTLLTRFYGLHALTLKDRGKQVFVVMGNVFIADKDINVVYDLKGKSSPLFFK